MKIKLLLNGKLHEPYRFLAHDYANRICKITNFELLEIKSKNFDSKVLSYKEKGFKICILDEKGKEFSSKEFADFLLKHEIGSTNLVFAIGSADGHSEFLKNNTDCFISLSKLTLMHELAALVFVEALYRSLSINKDLPYHRE